MSGNRDPQISSDLRSEALPIRRHMPTFRGVQALALTVLNGSHGTSEMSEAQ